MADEPAIVLGIENSSSLAWSAPQRFEKDWAKLSREEQHHLYLVVVGPKLTPTNLVNSSDPSEWKLDITYGKENGLKSHTITVSTATFPDAVLAFDPTKKMLNLVPTTGSGEQRKITVAEVIRAAIEAADEQPDWVEATVDELFTFEVAYIGKSHGVKKISYAIDRLAGGHDTVDKILSDTQDFNEHRAVAFITINQRMTSINANMKTGRVGDGVVVQDTVKLMAERFTKMLLDNPSSDDALSDTSLTKTTVTAAEAALITAFQPEWNDKHKDFTKTDAPALIKKLKADGYTHLLIHIDLEGSHVKVKGPRQGIPSSQHRWTFNLDTGAVESPGNGYWQQFNTPY